MQGTYETFVEMGRQHYGGDLAGKWMLTAGLGGMGGAQPLAATMAGASCLAIECQPIAHRDAAADRLSRRASRRPRRGARDRSSDSCRTRTPVSVGLLGNAAEVLPELVRRGVRPDCSPTRPRPTIPINGYLPTGWTLDAVGGQARDAIPRRSRAAAQALDGRARARHARLPEAGRAHRRLRQQHPPGGARRRA